MRMLWIVIVAIALGATRAEANDLRNVLAGPLIGLRLGGHDGPRGVVGVEGGAGLGPERINLGVEYRDGKLFGYAELDPWYLLGLSLGVGVDSDGAVQPVLGVWEGLPLEVPGCETAERDYGFAMTLAAGYRFTGVHEIYLSLKAGMSQPFRFC